MGSNPIPRTTQNKGNKMNLETTIIKPNKQININIKIDLIKQYGHFEIYSSNNNYYSEGGLWFADGMLIDYDGVYELPQTIKTQLKKWGFEV